MLQFHQFQAYCLAYFQDITSIPMLVRHAMRIVQAVYIEKRVTRILSVKLRSCLLNETFLEENLVNKPPIHK